MSYQEIKTELLSFTFETIADRVCVRVCEHRSMISLRCAFGS